MHALSLGVHIFTNQYCRPTPSPPSISTSLFPVYNPNRLPPVVYDSLVIDEDGILDGETLQLIDDFNTSMSILSANT